MRIQICIQLFISMRIRIQVVEPIKLQADPDPCQTLQSQKVDLFISIKY
jgi:hypothetical protein